MATNSPFVIGGSSGKSSAPPQPAADGGAVSGQTKPLEMAPQQWGGQTKPMAAAAPAAPVSAYDQQYGNDPNYTKDQWGTYWDSSGGMAINNNGVTDTSAPAMGTGILTGLNFNQNPTAAAGGGGQPAGQWQGNTKPLALDGPGGPGGFTAGGGPTSFGGGGFGSSEVMGARDDASRRRVEEALLSRLEPQFRRDESSMRNQLLSSGLEVGSPGYNSELERLSRNQNDARMSAVLAGGQEESRQVGMNSGLQNQGFNQGLQGAQFDNMTRQQMLSEMLLQRNTPLNELNALRTGSQVAMPNFQGYYTNNANAAPLFDAATAQGNYDSAQAANSQSGFNALVGGLAGLGGAALRYSDLRLKVNVKPLARTLSGVNLYSWDWVDGSGSDVGVIAQEVRVTHPQAVTESSNGLLMVDYSKLY